MRAIPPRLRLLRRLALAAATVVAAAACSDNDTAIFYYIENEQKVVDYTLDNQSTILGMGSLAGFYFVSLGGSMWRRSSGGTTWDKVALPSGTQYCGPLVDFGGDFYASLRVGSTWGLWKGSAAAQPVWTPVSDPELDGKQITGLFVAGGRLFASVQAADESHALYQSADPGSAAFEGTGVSGRPKPITQVTHDGADYYAATGTELYKGAFDSMVAATPAEADGKAIAGVYYSIGHDRVYAATEGGRLLSWDGASWTATADISVAGRTVRFRCIGEADPTTPLGGNILIGSMEHGAYQLPNGLIGSYKRLPDTTDSELYNGCVRDFFSDGPLTFALTSGSGLWHATWTPPDFSEWVRE